MSKILLVDDDPHSLDSTRRILEFSDFEVICAVDGKIAHEIIRKRKSEIRIVVSDIRMPNMTGMELLRAMRASQYQIPIILMTAYGSIHDAVEAMKLGAVDFLTKPFRKQEILDSVETALKRSKLSLLSDEAESHRMVGGSRVMKKLEVLIDQVAQTNATILITGESGTGKELVARQIHEKSNRHKKLFVAVNCAAIPENLMESELFGHEKGSFSGATQTKKGLFEEADGGTLLLDEIGDMPVGLQAKLLRVLQEGEIRRLGATVSKQFDVRVLSSTNQNLKEQAKLGNFRKDLLFRLDVIGVEVPPLRERQEDIESLSLYFLSCLNKKHSKAIEAISLFAKAALKVHPWPGNVRELYNTIERAVVLCCESEIQLENLPDHIRNQKIQESSLRSIGKTIEVPIGSRLKDVEDILIEKTLEATQGDKNTAARLLGVNSRTIYRKLEKKHQSKEEEQ